jgi:hypothetical protein
MLFDMDECLSCHGCPNNKLFEKEEFPNGKVDVSFIVDMPADEAVYDYIHSVMRDLDCVSYQILPTTMCGKPSIKAVDHCRDQIKRMYKHSKVVIGMGDFALRMLIGDKWNKNLGDVEKWRGYVIPLSQHTTVTWNPSVTPFTVKDNDERRQPTGFELPHVMKMITKDIERAVACIDKPLNHVNPITRIISEGDSIEILKNAKIISAFDFETTGLRPINAGHKVVSMSVAYLVADEIVSYAFLIGKENIQAVREYLSNPDKKKIGCNIKFEDTWAKTRLNVKVRGWILDIMLTQHIMDNRDGVTSLKFQAFTDTGHIWNDTTSPFLKADDCNSINNIMNCDMNELLKYNAIDSWHTFRIGMKQLKELGYDDNTGCQQAIP